MDERGVLNGFLLREAIIGKVEHVKIEQVPERGGDRLSEIVIA